MAVALITLSPWILARRMDTYGKVVRLVIQALWSVFFLILGHAFGIVALVHSILLVFVPVLEADTGVDDELCDGLI